MRDKTDQVRRQNRGPLTDWSEGFDTFEEVDPVKLRYWAAICLEFNYAEQTLTDIMGLSCCLEAWLNSEISSRINSTESKVEIIKVATRASKTLTGEPAEAICQTLGFFTACKRYRDVIAHTVIHGIEADIVYTYARKGIQYEADISTPTLEAIYAHTFHCGLEIAKAYRMAEHHLDEYDLIPNGDRDPKEIRASENFQTNYAQLQQSQSQRKNLPPIPPFPRGHLPFPEWAKDLDPRLKDD